MDSKKIKIIFPLISLLLLISLLASSFACTRQSIETQTGLPSTFEKILEIPHTLDGIRSMSWDRTGEKFLIVGGEDQGGGNPVHTRFILSGDTSGIEIIEFVDFLVDDPELDDRGRYTHVMYSPTEDYALVSGYGGLWKFSEGQMEAIYTTGGGAITWEPHGEYALISGGPGGMLKYDGTSIQEIDTGGHGFIDASWSPGGTYVLLADNALGEIGRYDGESFSTLTIPENIIPETITGHDQYLVQTVSFSPVSEYALIGTQNRLVNGPFQALLGYNGTEFELIGHINQFPEDMFWKPDGSLAYVGGSSVRNTMTIYEDGTISTIDTGLIDMGSIGVVKFRPALGWSRDGEYLVIRGAEAIEFWGVTS